MIRLFIAVPVPQEIRLILHAMGRGLPGARAVPEDQIHITVRFIGEVEGGLFHDIRESLESVKIAQFPLSIQGVGHFPPRKNPRVIWAGLQNIEQLLTLKNTIDTSLKDCGISAEQRKFAAHVTLARLHHCPLKRVTDFLAGNSFLSFDAFIVDHFNLYSSRLTDKGAIHTLEQSYYLQP